MQTMQEGLLRSLKDDTVIDISQYPCEELVNIYATIVNDSSLADDTRNNFIQRYTIQFARSSNYYAILSSIRALLSQLENSESASASKYTLIGLAKNNEFSQKIIDYFCDSFDITGEVCTSILQIIKASQRAAPSARLLHTIMLIISSDCSKTDRAKLLDYLTSFTMRLDINDLHHLLRATVIDPDSKEGAIKIISRMVRRGVPGNIQQDLEQLVLSSLTGPTAQHALMCLAYTIQDSTLPVEQLINAIMRGMLQISLGPPQTRNALTALKKLTLRDQFTEQFCKQVDEYLYATPEHQAVALDCIGRCSLLPAMHKYYDLALCAVLGIAPFTQNVNCQKIACRVARQLCQKSDPSQVTRIYDVLIPHLYNADLACQVASELRSLAQIKNDTRTYNNQISSIVMELLPTCDTGRTFVAFNNLLSMLAKKLEYDTLIQLADFAVDMHSKYVVDSTTRQKAASTLSMLCSVCAALPANDLATKYASTIYAQANVSCQPKITTEEQYFDYEGDTNNPLLLTYHLLSIIASKIELTEEQLRKTDFVHQVIEFTDKETLRMMCFEILYNLAKGPTSHVLIVPHYDNIMVAVLDGVEYSSWGEYLRPRAYNVMTCLLERFPCSPKLHSKRIIDFVTHREQGDAEIHVLCALCPHDMESVTAVTFRIPCDDPDTYDTTFQSMFRRACRPSRSELVPSRAMNLSKIIQAPDSYSLIDACEFIMFIERNFSVTDLDSELARCIGEAMERILEKDKTICLPSSSIFRYISQMIRSSFTGRNMLKVTRFKDLSVICRQ